MPTYAIYIAGCLDNCTIAGTQISTQLCCVAYLGRNPMHGCSEISPVDRIAVLA